MKTWCLLLIIPLAACSYTTYLSGADEHGGTVNLVNQFSHDSAVEKAKEHCQEYKLDMRVVSNDPQSQSLNFVCQPADFGKTKTLPDVAIH